MKKILKIVVAAFMLYAVTAAFFGFETDLACDILGPCYGNWRKCWSGK